MAKTNGTTVEFGGAYGVWFAAGQRRDDQGAAFEGEDAYPARDEDYDVPAPTLPEWLVAALERDGWSGPFIRGQEVL